MLSEENIKLVENFINNNNCDNLYPNLSFNDVENAKLCYQEIKNLPITSYILFGSNAFGMTSYGFYKTKDDKIYIIEAYINKISKYYNPNNCYFLVEPKTENKQV